MKKYYEEHEDWYENETEAVKQRYEWLEEEYRLEIKSFEELRYKRITRTDGEKRFINDFGDYFKHYCSGRFITTRSCIPTYEKDLKRI
ncbi:hypothetical protein [Bacillus cereus]|uniref:hypothetical protein n=1 Tax=Bacillus cereus TaxID=1396 RepID=UPI00211D5F1B|nr:hypothetical protein [Bacillus cereus]